MRFTCHARVAVVVPVHNGLRHTRGLLSELRRSDYDEATVVIVDDGSTDGTGEYLRERQPDVVVLRGSGDLWWSGAANVGCRYAIENGAEVLVLFNNDNVEVSSNCITDLVHWVDRFEGCASSVARMAHSGRLIHAGGFLRWPFRGIELRNAGEIYRAADRVVECDWLPGTSLAFSADLFNQLHGFDESAFPQYCGDTDFTLRARAKGKPCLVSYRSWIANDETSKGVHFHARISLSSFVSGLFSRRSSYQLRTTVRFARRYCPKLLIPAYLTQFYLRYAYATVKTWLPARLRMALSR
jgi:GT2 family glycosyltransferase